MMRNRAPFIWTPRQPVNPTGFLSGLHFAADRSEGTNRWFLFRKEILLPARPEAAPLKITVDGRYQLFVNGHRVGRGPVRCDPFHQKYDTFDVADKLHEGANCIAVLVHVYGVDTAWYEKTKGMWVPTFGDGGLWVDGTAVFPGRSGAGQERVSLSTDTDWSCIESEAWDRDTERMNSGLGFIESLDARKVPDGWQSAGFDDSGWDRAQVLHVSAGGPESFFGGIVTEPFPNLLPNPLPPLEETVIAPESVRMVRAVAALPDLPVHRACYEEPFLEVEPLVEDAQALLAQDDRAAQVRTRSGEGVMILMRMPGLLSGYPLVEVDARGGEIIDIAVAERLAGEFTEAGISEDARIVPTPVLGHDAHVARFVAKPGRQTFERFEWSAAKWLQVTIRNAPEGIAVRFAGVNHTCYPAGKAGAFASDDPFLDQLWETGRKTVQLCMHDGWEDCPSREQRQWLGDVTVEHLVSQTAFGPAAHALTAKYLRDVAASQRPDGLTQMFAPGDHNTNGLLIPDWTLQWILTASDYLLWTGDEATIEAIFPAIERAVQWFELQRGQSGLVTDMPYWHFMDWAGVGRHGEACALNAQYAGALDAAAGMAEILENPRAARRLRGAAGEIRGALNARHWDEERGIYVDVVDPATGLQELRTSQHANAGMILWGDVPPDRWQRIVERITDPARLTFTAGPPVAPAGETLDEREGVVLANTFYSHFVFCALAKARRADLALGLMRQKLGPMLDAGADTLWESLGPTASLCHGFSASPTYQLVHAVAGLQPTVPGARVLRLSPQLAHLERIETTLPILGGDVNLSLRREGGHIRGSVAVPAGLEVHLDDRHFDILSGSPVMEGGTHNFEIRAK